MRVALVAAIWFCIWMTLGSVIGAYTGGDHGDWENALYGGIFNGAWLALLTSFTWPWVMPRRLARWMYREPPGTA